MKTATETGLSKASKHGLALVKLQGYKPTERMLTLLAQLDAGEVTQEEAEATVLSWYIKT